VPPNPQALHAAAAARITAPQQQLGTRVGSRLSISRAWDETKAVAHADGRLIFVVALAFVALPSAIGQFVNPRSSMAGGGGSPGLVLLSLAIALIGIVGQLAIIRLALGPSTTVGQAIADGARRTVPYIGAALLIVAGLVLVAIPFVGALVSMGVTFERSATPPPLSAVLLMLVYAAVVLFVGTRMLLTSPVAIGEPVGPLGMIRRSWALTRGHFWKLLGFVLLFLLGAILALGALGIAAGLIARLIAGPVEPLSVGALFVALVEGAANAFATSLFVLMVARIYVQLVGAAGAETSVPSSGT
jgi:hypothetical protein